MWAFALRRFLHTIPILLGVSLIVFLLVRLMPGDAADVLIPPEAPREVRDMLRAGGYRAVEVRADLAGIDPTGDGPFSIKPLLGLAEGEIVNGGGAVMHMDWAHHQEAPPAPTEEGEADTSRRRSDQFKRDGFFSRALRPARAWRRAASKTVPSAGVHAA